MEEFIVKNNLIYTLSLEKYSEGIYIIKTDSETIKLIVKK
jgi:hypothetical protein